MKKNNFLENILDSIGEAGGQTVGALPEGADAELLVRLAGSGRTAGILHIARDEGRMLALAEALRFFAPELRVREFPAWDCLPYDRSPPHASVEGKRIEVLAALARPDEEGGPGVLLTTVNACLQRLPTRESLKEASFAVRAAAALDPQALIAYLEAKGYGRAESVMEPGEFAVRGGIVDVYPPGTEEPLRLDFFGDDLEGIRRFDPFTQRSAGAVAEFRFRPISELVLDAASIARFRAGYREAFGTVTAEDRLYESVSAGVRFPGMEHWLPLFHDRLETLFDYMPGALVSLDHQAREVAKTRFEQITEYYETRKSLAGEGLREGGDFYHPLPPEALYLGVAEWERALEGRAHLVFSPFAEGGASLDAGGKAVLDFAAARKDPKVDVFREIQNALTAAHRAGKRCLIASHSAGSRERLQAILGHHGIEALMPAESWPEVEALASDQTALVVLGLERGFSTPALVVVTEEDILGERLGRAQKRRRAKDVLTHAASLMPGDLVVHSEHGIARYDELVTVEVQGAPHDCLRLLYAEDNRLFLPVENIELLSRYGSEEGQVALDRLGGVAWQARKSRMKRRVRDMANELIRIAAQRAMQPGEVVAQPEGYDEFCARFPYPETEDQQNAIEDTLNDLAQGRPMDRLICGDVGFGKTEVALRAAYVAALAGHQVAVVVPTTLLARQHFETFRARFAGFPVRIAQISRLVPAREQAEIRERLANGEVNIVIGTHALLGKAIRFADLGLLIIDEEQHFGVAHKERLKKLRANVHVLTMTATPIPRTLQLALSGVREMSVIATPPLDRVAVRSFVLPDDPVIVREAILRERLRGGQVFYVCPRIEDLAKVEERLKRLVPEVRLGLAHGRMTPAALEKVMLGFYEGATDVLVSTNIIESGLDIATANTLIVHRSDMFGLAQLYQLRGRIGRSKSRAYAYLTIPPNRILTEAATKRLQTMQALDSLGAGFQLASHDLDIRGAGNLLGEEQSGHIREVGVELYQHLLEEAVAEARGERAKAAGEAWTPEIHLGMPVLIPEDYVADLGLRLELYRRIARLENRAEIEEFAAELIDRFGPIPKEVENLLETVAIKQLCKAAGIGRLEAGPKGALIGFYKDRFAKPERLADFLMTQVGEVKLRPDHKLVYRRGWEDLQDRVTGVRHLVENLAKLAA
ncbi:MAG: transcription-repair coupling factor [Alphaproteobacteria bacterium]|nr:transcription-repair coupling factor [Alphaproteobacteria bacterium]